MDDYRWINGTSIFAPWGLLLIYYLRMLCIQEINTLCAYFWNFYYSEVVKSFIQGVLPGIILKIFLALLPMLLMAMSKIEGYTSLSSLDRRSATKYHIFILVNVFLGSIITGAAFEQLQRFMEKPPSEWVSTAH